MATKTPVTRQESKRLLLDGGCWPEAVWSRSRVLARLRFVRGGVAFGVCHLLSLSVRLSPSLFKLFAAGEVVFEAEGGRAVSEFSVYHSST